MAVTKIWPVRGRADKPLEYVANELKTANPKWDKSSLGNLTDVMHYAADENKTEKQFFVSGINCSPEIARDQFVTVKKQFGKEDGIVAYHGYQSFKSGEVTPKEAHEIGLETARRMWGKSYEIVVTTHLNTDNIHNHIVINSVSFKTGMKFENHISDHIRLREISDAVCKEYGKSVIEGAKFYSAEKNAYWIHKRGGKTHRDILREDVDSAIKQAGNLLEFERIMGNFGYTFNRNIMTEHPSVIAKGWKRAVRIDSLGKDYTRERIIKRIADNKIFVSSFGKSERVQRTKPKHTPLMELEYQLRRVKYMDTVEALFYLLLELLKPSTPKPNYTPPLSPVLRQELRKFEQYQKQFRLLHDEQINTVPELEAFIGKLSMQISELEEERSKTDNKRRRAKTDDDKEMYLAEIRGISAQIKPIRDKLKIAKATLETIPKIEKLFDIEREMERKVIQKERSKER